MSEEDFVDLVVGITSLLIAIFLLLFSSFT